MKFTGLDGIINTWIECNGATQILIQITKLVFRLQRISFWSD